MGREQQGSSRMQETTHAFLSPFIKTSVTRTKPFIHCQALMAATGKNRKQQTGCHSLAIGLKRKMYKITKPRKLNNFITEFFKAPEMTIYKKIMSFNCLKTA